MTTPRTNKTSAPPPLDAGAPYVKVLAEVWGGSRVTVVDSPPGAGKSTLIVDLVRQLVLRAGLRVSVAAPTRAAAANLATKMKQARGDASFFWVNLVEAGQSFTPTLAPGPRSVDVSTVAKLQHSRQSQVGLDVLVVDEAYQLTFAQLSQAAAEFRQLVLVGDPGQIGPVVRGSTAALEEERSRAHLRSPEAFAGDPDVARINLEATYRLGAETAAVVSLFYPWGFESRRPDTSISLPCGGLLPEITQHQIAPAASVSSLAHLREVANIATSLIGGTISRGGVTRTLSAEDVAVVTSHSAQCDRLAGLLPDGMIAGTADRLQGGQWPVVVAVDPLVGHSTPGAHQVAPGRLCVMLSRHQGALVWLHDGQPEKLVGLAANQSDARLGLEVRRRLLGKPLLHDSTPSGS